MKFIICLILFTQAVYSGEDYSWVLGPQISDSNNFAHHKKAKSLLKTFVHDRFTSKKYKITLLDDVWKNIVFPGSKTVIEKTFLIVEGARPHDVQSKGMIWFDLKKSLGAFAINSCPSDIKIDFECILIGSSQFSFDELPQEFINTFVKWKNSLPQKNLPVKFLGKDNKEVDTKL